MFSVGRGEAKLRALGQKVSLKGLPDVQPVFLAQLLIGLSQTLNGGAAQPEALARALILDGQQRLRELRNARPHLELSLEHLLSKIRGNETMGEHLSDVENAVQAVLGMCLGLMLRWLSGSDDQSHPRPSSGLVKRLPSFDVLLPSCLSSYPLFRARSCLIS